MFIYDSDSSDIKADKESMILFITQTILSERKAEREKIKEWAEKYQGDYFKGDFVDGKHIQIPLIELSDLKDFLTREEDKKI